MSRDTPEDRRCPECGSSAVLEADTIGLHCVECGNEWPTVETSAHYRHVGIFEKVIFSIAIATLTLFMVVLMYVTVHVHHGTIPQGVSPEAWNAFVQDPIGSLYAGVMFRPSLTLWVLSFLWVIASVSLYFGLPGDRERVREELKEVETEQREGDK